MRVCVYCSDHFYPSDLIQKITRTLEVKCKYLSEQIVNSARTWLSSNTSCTWKHVNHSGILTWAILSTWIVCIVCIGLCRYIKCPLVMWYLIKSLMVGRIRSEHTILFRYLAITQKVYFLHVSVGRTMNGFMEWNEHGIGMVQSGR